ncbi:transmembrane protein 92-like [Erpetoichthys calabaricus]|uniref:transmembrane protein 92-like n=1 Tax=Erpetoichthys calabaricus TaxID=27687 RepID=UPI00109F5497|nr:transmembrane protein 92-like [Erpetoichthys calabaricus]XP_039595442.1 transmembrane protein 92-like [Polypterus senegalus]
MMPFNGVSTVEIILPIFLVLFLFACCAGLGKACCCRKENEPPPEQVTPYIIQVPYVDLTGIQLPARVQEMDSPPPYSEVELKPYLFPLGYERPPAYEEHDAQTNIPRMPPPQVGH